MPHDGGAFYTNDTMESSRPHYANTWPPILHAATLWLNAGSLNSTLTQGDTDNDNALNNNATDCSGDKFHLLFGNFVFVKFLDRFN